MNNDKVIELIIEQGVLPLFYHDDIEVCKDVVDVLYSAGIRAVEFTNRGRNAHSNFKQLVALQNERWQGIQLGIGTILNIGDALKFIEAGAAFIICPGVIPAIGDVVTKSGLIWIPGCLTPTEVMIAKDKGAKLVKIFPGSLIGPSYIAALKEVFGDMLFMPTGGVDISEDNLSSWFKAGVCGVGLGSKVISKSTLINKNYALLDVLIRQALETVKKVRNRD